MGGAVSDDPRAVKTGEITMPKPLSSPIDARVCTRSGLQNKIWTDRLVTLRDLEATLKEAIHEANHAITMEKVWAVAATGTKIVGVTCDLTIALVADKAGIPGQAAGSIYDVAKLVVDGFNGEISVKKGLLFSGGIHIDAIAEVLKMRKLHEAEHVLKGLKLLVATTQDLYDYWQDNKDVTWTRSGVVGARNNALRLLVRIREQIGDVENRLAQCDESGP
jgi:hypothetical protein